MLPELLSKFSTGDVQALSRLISHVEDRAAGYEEIIAALHPRTGNAYKVGITGPPGAGKSSLVDHLAARAAAQGKVAVIAADPTSPFSGGAFLGDRVRMQRAAVHNNVYIRSMASRGATGGLPAAAFDVALLLDAFGIHWIFLETVGVGQIELDVAEHADTIIIVLSPESGDAIQAAKAGVLEIGEIFVVNKSDRPGATSLVQELESVLDLRRTGQPWHYPVLSTVATTGTGTEELFATIEEHRRFLTGEGHLEARRREQMRRHLRKIVAERIHAVMEEQFQTNSQLEHLAGLVYEKKESPYGAVERIMAQWRNVR
ncbi:MAG: methylmalonyl Co-A mutase-associated GTPase MeaB [Kiritimatiellia bacterium]